MTRAPRSGTGGAPSHPPSGAGTWRLPPPAQSPAADGFTWGQAAEEAGSDAPGMPGGEGKLRAQPVLGTLVTKPKPWGEGADPS